MEVNKSPKIKFRNVVTAKIVYVLEGSQFNKDTLWFYVRFELEE